MKLLVGRFVLGCISAILVLADSSTDVVTEKLIESSPDFRESVINQNISLPDVVTETTIKSSPDLPSEINKKKSLPETTPTSVKHSKTYTKPAHSGEKKIEHGIVVIHDQSGGGHHDHGYHDHGYDRDHGYDHDHHHYPDYHHPPPPRPPPHHHHDHHHPPPHHHTTYPQPYPGYYPPQHYPMSYPHRMSQPYAASAMPPPYPYYPPPTYYNTPPMKPTTVIQTSTSSSNPIQNYPKPTDLINQGTEYLWNLFGKLGAISGDNQDNALHEVVLINTKAAPSAPMQMLPPLWYTNKGKNVPNIDCNNKKE